MLKTFGKRVIRGKKEKDLTKWDRYVILIKIDSEKRLRFLPISSGKKIAIVHTNG